MRCNRYTRKWAKANSSSANVEQKFERLENEFGLAGNAELAASKAERYLVALALLFYCYLFDVSPLCPRTCTCKPTSIGATMFNLLALKNILVYDSIQVLLRQRLCQGVLDRHGCPRVGSLRSPELACLHLLPGRLAPQSRAVQACPHNGSSQRGLAFVCQVSRKLMFVDDGCGNGNDSGVKGRGGDDWNDANMVFCCRFMIVVVVVAEGSWSDCGCTWSKSTYPYLMY